MSVQQSSGEHPFIVLEGASGTGKTTVAGLVARALGGVAYATPPAPFIEIRDRIDAACNDHAGAAARCLFYLAGVLYAAGEIADLLRTRAVVCDRYIATTVAYHRLLGYSPSLAELAPHLRLPDLTVVLTCDDATRRRRIDGRGWSANDQVEERLRLAPAFEAELVVVTRALGGRAQLVDTTNQNPEQVAHAVLRLTVSCPVARRATSGERPRALPTAVTGRAP